MPVKNYGVLKVSPLESREGTSRSPHYQIRVVDRQTDTAYRIAINVLSQVQPYNLLYHVIDDFKYPTLAALQELPDGFTKLASRSGGLAIDFLRSDIVNENKLRPVLFTDTGSETQLNDLLHDRVQQAIADPDARIYAFGDHWGPEEDKPDKYFGFEPGNGIHDIHMNQGNDPGHRHEDGVWQDGALMIFLPASNRWMAVFLKFQSQSLHTDDTTGHATDGRSQDGGYNGPSHEGHHHHHHHKHS
jgi:uncharacterized protein YukJ